METKQRLQELSVPGLINYGASGFPNITWPSCHLSSFLLTHVSLFLLPIWVVQSLNILYSFHMWKLISLPCDSFLVCLHLNARGDLFTYCDWSRYVTRPNSTAVTFIFLKHPADLYGWHKYEAIPSRQTFHDSSIGKVKLENITNICINMTYIFNIYCPCSIPFAFRIY